MGAKKYRSVWWVHSFVEKPSPISIRRELCFHRVRLMAVIHHTAKTVFGHGADGGVSRAAHTVWCSFD